MAGENGAFEERHLRQEMLFGRDSTAKLRASHVAVFGLGGVGSFAVEALARSGIGHLTLVDRDAYAASNLNRQLFATEKTVGMPKVLAAEARVREIDSTITVTPREIFFLPENAGEFDFSAFDYVVDAVDTVAAKMALIRACHEAGTPIVSCMGAGNKKDPTAFRLADIYETDVCPLARVIRAECRRAGIPHLAVVYSREMPDGGGAKDPGTGKPVPASCAFVPSVAGLILAGKVVGDLCDARILRPMLDKKGKTR